MLVAEHYDAIEADLWMHCHRTDLRDLWRPGGGEAKLTWRLVANLIRHLPSESAFKTAMRNKMTTSEIERASKDADPSQGQWSHLEMLIAAQGDTLRWIAYILAVANGAKAAKRPEPTPRPGVSPKRPRLSASQAQARADAVWRRIHGEPISGSWQHSEPGKVTHLPRS